MDWFTFDWYDDTDHKRQSEKYNWRVLYLEQVKVRAKARFNNKLNNIRKKKTNVGTTNKKDTQQMKFLSSDIPWDNIMPDIFLMTSFCMEIAVIKFSFYLFIYTKISFF